MRDAFSWSGPTAPGQWHFRVGVVGAVIDSETLNCLDMEVSWGTDEVNVDRPLTAAEWQAFAIDLCANVRVSGMGGWFEREMVHLEWWIDDDYLFETGHHYNEHYQDYALGYRIEKRRVDGAEWRHVTDLVDERRWKGQGEPGTWEYRAAMVLVSRESQSVSCGDLTWARAEVLVPTAEEIAKEKAEREILVAEMLRCRVESLTANIGEVARPIILAQIEKLTQEQAEDADEFEELAQLTMLTCATSGDTDMGP